MRGVVLALLALLAPAAALAQTPTWEMLPLFPPQRPQARFTAVDFLYGEGEAGSDPAADSLVIFGSYGVFLYNPSGAGGAAGSNGEWGAWHRLCRASGTNCGTVADGLVTAAGSIVVGTQNLSRATHRGRVWQYQIEGFGPFPFLESSLPALVGPTGAPGILVGAGDDGLAVRSLGDGAPGTWVDIGTGYGYPQSFGEVPPSAALPGGRILYGVWNGVVYSDDGGLSFTPSNAFGQAAYIAHSFAFLPDAAHPYGGVAYAGVADLAYYPGPGTATVLRSDDGGATWTPAHRFTAADLDLPNFPGEIDVDLLYVTALLVTPDGALWAGVSFSSGVSTPARGGIARSEDGGATWSRADGAFRDATGRGYEVSQLRLARDGRLYAATVRGVWRTTTAVVSADASPTAASSGLSLTARPNPASGAVTLALSSERAERVRVEVVDAAGRVVYEAVEVWATPGGTELRLPSEQWAAGVYVVRASVGRHVEHVTARFTVVR